MNKLSPVGNLAKFYEDQPLVQAAVQLASSAGLPLVGVFDVLAKGRAAEIAKERAKVFYDELARNWAIITPEMAQSEDFIHRFVITAQAAVNTRRREKIEQFARLLTASLAETTAISTDEYEEYLNILSDLSVREVVIMGILETFQRDRSLAIAGNDIQRCSVYWPEFLSKMKDELDIDRKEAAAILSRLNRTGCYRTLTGAGLGYEGDMGRLTPMYFKLKSLIQQESQGI